MVTIKSLSESRKQKMSSYNTFAQFYDKLTENVDYKVRSSYISNFFSLYSAKKGRVLDLACGTGSLSSELSKLGYSVTGIDLSDDMLSVASAKKIESAEFYKRDMTDFQFDEKFDFCVCSLDSINHLENEKDVKKCFDCVAAALNSGGVFVFDVNTVFKHKHILADNAFVFDEEDFFLAWDNEQLSDNRVRILLDFFVFNGQSYDRFSEEIIEKAYDTEILKTLLSDDFKIIGVYDELTNEPEKEYSERLYFVCKRK